MPILIFRGVYIRQINARMAGSNVADIIHLSADMSEPVAQVMGWGPIDKAISEGKLKGKLAGLRLVLVPYGPLATHGIQLDVGSVEKFSVHRVQNKDGQGTRVDLRFQVITSDPAAAAQLHAYWGLVGDQAAQMKLEYNEQAPLFGNGVPAAKAKKNQPPPITAEVVSDPSPAVVGESGETVETIPELPVDNALNAIKPRGGRRKAALAEIVSEEELAERDALAAQLANNLTKQ